MEALPISRGDTPVVRSYVTQVACLPRRHTCFVFGQLTEPARPHGGCRGALVFVTSAAVAAASIAACSPGGSTSTSSKAPSTVTTDVADTATTLTVFTGAGTKGFTQGLADAFHAKYPKITMKLQVEADNNYNTVLPRLLASDSPPDLAAPADLIGAVKDNLVVNLDSYDKAYGWSSKVPSSVLSEGRVSNGVIGSGSLYTAGGSAGPLVGVYFNKALAAKVGMTDIPASIGDLEALMDKAKAQGITPIEASNEDGLIGHLYSLLLGNYMGPQALLDIVNHASGANLNTPAAVAATTKLQDWIKAGYFNTDANAINQDASYGAFAAGKVLFMFQGSWMVQALPASFAGQYGIFAMPPNTSGGKQVSMTGNSLAYAIAAHSKHQAAAALFLNFLTTSTAAGVAVTNGYPALGAPSSVTPSLTASISDQIQAGYSVVGSDNGFDSWLQNSDPAVNTAETQQLQLLVAGQTTPAKMVSTLQDTYAKAIASK